MPHSSTAQWIASVSTFLAVLVALLKETIVATLRKPSLKAKSAF